MQTLLVDILQSKTFLQQRIRQTNGLIPDIIIKFNNIIYIIDVSIPFDTQVSPELRKVAKSVDIGKVLSFVIGAPITRENQEHDLGSWQTINVGIRHIYKIPNLNGIHKRSH